MDFVVVLLVLMAVTVFVSAPLRRLRTAEGPNASDVAELEAARDAKYREIRDAELDHGTGKLSDADYEAIDGTLRTEAIEILHRLDTISGR
jgi:hypothetical protein